MKFHPLTKLRLADGTDEKMGNMKTILVKVIFIKTAGQVTYKISNSWAFML